MDLIPLRLNQPVFFVIMPSRIGTVTQFVILARGIWLMMLLSVYLMIIIIVIILLDFIISYFN